MITTPFSLELTRGQDAIDIVEDTVPDTVSASMKIFLGANVNPGKVQSYVGSLRACFRHLMNEQVKRDTEGVSLVVRGDWLSASAGNITFVGGTGQIGADDVAIVVAGTFADEGATHFYDETFKQLINGLLERTKAN